MHAAFDAEAPSLELPAWLNEGVAEWFEARAVGQRRIGPRQRAILAQLGQQQGEFEHTAELYQESLDLLRKMGVEASIADVQFNLARFVQAHGYLDLAGHLYRECLDLFTKQGNMARVAQCEAGLAAVGSRW